MQVTAQVSLFITEQPGVISVWNGTTFRNSWTFKMLIAILAMKKDY